MVCIHIIVSFPVISFHVHIFFFWAFCVIFQDSVLFTTANKIDIIIRCTLCIIQCFQRAVRIVLIMLRKNVNFKNVNYAAFMISTQSIQE